ncbi:hypothetical protein V8E53_010672 [Lactarius tabidus]
MDDQWAIPNTDQLHRHVVPPTAERPGPHYQNTLTPGQDTRATIPNCSCPWCSDAQPRPPPTSNHAEQRGPSHYGDAIVNQDRGEGNRLDTSVNVPNRASENLLTVQAAGAQDNFSYAPVRDRAGPSNVGFPQAPTVDALIAEGRRRLAGRYLNNPEAYVSMIRLEPSPSGQFQVIITLEMANIL